MSLSCSFASQVAAPMHASPLPFALQVARVPCRCALDAGLNFPAAFELGSDRSLTTRYLLQRTPSAAELFGIGAASRQAAFNTLAEQMQETAPQPHAAHRRARSCLCAGTYDGGSFRSLLKYGPPFAATPPASPKMASEHWTIPDFRSRTLPPTPHMRYTLQISHVLAVRLHELAPTCIGTACAAGKRALCAAPISSSC